MKKQFFGVILMLLSSNFLHAQQNRKLVWADEFNYHGLPDSNKWTYHILNDQGLFIIAKK